MGRIGGYVARRRRLHGSTRLAVPVGPVPGRGGLTALADRQDGRDKFMAQTWGHGSAEAGGCPTTGWPWGAATRRRQSCLLGPRLASAHPDDGAAVISRKIRLIRRLLLCHSSHPVKNCRTTAPGPGCW